jgi:hypothetical protein
MKKVTLIILIALITTTLTSFKSIPVNDFGPWKTSSCYRGIDYCVKRDSYNEYAKKYKWIIKFRNRYTKQISFNCFAVPSNVTTGNGVNGLRIDSDKEGEDWFLVADANAIRVIIDNVRLDNEYLKCDNN